MSRGIALLALGLSACGPSLPHDGSQSRAAIVGGVADPGDPAVVSLVADGWPVCSGTLIAPRAVLTAGHCANVVGVGEDYEIAFGSDARHPTQKVKVVAQVLHPQFTDEGAPHDFALLELDEPVTDVAPARLGTAPLTSDDVGRTLRHVGFGVNVEADGTGGGLKRQASYPITEVDPWVVWSGGPGAQTCTGDSGGPAFLARDGGEELVAVVSDGPSCHEAGWDGRVDLIADWIAETDAAWEPDAGAPISVDGGSSNASMGCGGCGSATGSGWWVSWVLALSAFTRRARPRA